MLHLGFVGLSWSFLEQALRISPVAFCSDEQLMQDQTYIPPSMDDAAQSLLKDLNEQQKVAASHGSGPLLIVAGAGTGKTTTLTHRVAWLIHSGTDPRRALIGASLPWKHVSGPRAGEKTPA